MNVLDENLLTTYTAAVQEKYCTIVNLPSHLRLYVSESTYAKLGDFARGIAIGVDSGQSIHRLHVFLDPFLEGDKFEITTEQPTAAFDEWRARHSKE